MKKLLFTLGGVITMFCACNFSNVSINDQQDNEDGKAFVNAFYANIANKDYKKIVLR